MKEGDAGSMGDSSDFVPVIWEFGGVVVGERMEEGLGLWGSSEREKLVVENGVCGESASDEIREMAANGETHLV